MIDTYMYQCSKAPVGNRQLNFFKSVTVQVYIYPIVQTIRIKTLVFIIWIKYLKLPNLLVSFQIDFKFFKHFKQVLIYINNSSKLLQPRWTCIAWIYSYVPFCLNNTRMVVFFSHFLMSLTLNAGVAFTLSHTSSL